MFSTRPDKGQQTEPRTYHIERLTVGYIVKVDRIGDYPGEWYAFNTAAEALEFIRKAFAEIDVCASE